MRGFSTDRPTKSNVPYTVDAGHFQYETDLVNYTHQVSGSTHIDTLLVPNPTFKVGLTNNVDLEVNVPFAGVHTFGSGPATTLWGIGDTFVRSKINLWAMMAAIPPGPSYRMSKPLQHPSASATAQSKEA